MARDDKCRPSHKEPNWRFWKHKDPNWVFWDTGKNYREASPHSKKPPPNRFPRNPPIPSRFPQNSLGHPVMPLPNGRQLKRPQRVKWSEVSKHIGKIVKIYGKIKSVSGGNNVQFINIGADYPSLSRFTIVVVREEAFLNVFDSGYLGETIAVTGKVYLHDDVYHVQVQSPSQMRILEQSA